MLVNGVSQNISFQVIINETATELTVDGKIHDELVIGARLYFKK